MSGKVLIACERSQVVCSAFRSFGVEAYSCDILSCYGQHPQWHILGDAIQVAYSGEWSLMVAHSSPTVRSRTFPGIAHAMANQWRGFFET